MRILVGFDDRQLAFAIITSLAENTIANLPRD
jgi:hypothetical protein